ncbi:alpha/beta hydrolase [Granulosicoccus antarcticus]|uniref:Thermostable monoacylglycerol lipase n=1 Tax=Granulosicoccus antarcticus IMCC3135 TaxID=1192854 RepID=A0A2Z2NTI2_9GAMM|nr:alpha/beta fold hydrolase [Granulosicoccus antarcticus]ASJ73361.1 Thermostable monoacylglycerol lipase [Granulosicoccus antarcticus IMCC3135]
MPSCKRRTSLLFAATVSLATLIGCATQKGNLAPAESLEPAGWLDVDTSLLGDHYSDYVADVRQRLESHRLLHDPSQAELEIERAAPREYPAADHCGAKVAGIAILVHGLSDTAFAMRDLAQSLSKQCYIARTALLPGHGTRAGDLLAVTHEDWTNTVRYLTEQAAREHDRVVLVGYSLGAIATMTVALDENSPVDALLAISPAYNISTMSSARFAPWLYWVYPWIDKGNSDDSQRYESMPTRAVAELVGGLKVMNALIEQRKGYDQPWMLIQSRDDSSTVPVDNQAFVLEYASDPRSRVINFYSDQSPEAPQPDVQWIPGTNLEYRVTGLTHLAVHIAPDNPHYGADGDYRGCGATDGRDLGDAKRCSDAEKVWYADWSKLPEVGAEPPTAISTFNPEYAQMETAISAFLSELDNGL